MPNQELQSKQFKRILQFPLAELDQTLAIYGFQPVRSSDVSDFHALADALIDGPVADPEAISRVQAWTQRSLHLRYRHGRPDALLASIPLTGAGREAILDGRFGFENARREWVCGLDEPAQALLSWGMAGRTPMAQLAALRGLLAGWYHFYRDVRVFARARSLQGRALMGRLQFSELGCPDGSAPLFGSTRFPDRLARHLRAVDPQKQE
ncbi:MAG: hypothetical protein GYB36_04165 [Alphaproteobacteria bacterium]|nr:hypothetical protein [Alphaproteobacteria bacterium]